MKEELRKKLLEKRNSLTNQEIQEKSHHIFQKLIPYFKKAKCIGLYHSFLSEVDTNEMLAYLIEQGKTVCLPVCEKQGIMHFYEIDSNTKFQKSKFGIYEPMNAKKIDKQMLDLIIVPMLGYYENRRLGYGGGYYDRYLATCHAYKIGVAFSIQELEFENEAYDIHMDIIIHE